MNLHSIPRYNSLLGAAITIGVETILQNVIYKKMNKNEFHYQIVALIKHARDETTMLI